MRQETTIDDGERSLAELRKEFRGLHDFGEDPGRVEWLKLGPVPIPVPNPPSRVRALLTHDLHHIVAGYDTDLVGEFQVSGWECGAGLRTNALAWIFCPAGVLGGMLRCPRRTVAAYARGRTCRSLFGQDLPRLDATPLALARTWCGTDATTERRSTPADWAGAFGWAALGLFVLVLPPLAWVLAAMSEPPSPLRATGHDDAPA